MSSDTAFHVADLDSEIRRVHAHLQTLSPDAKEYAAALSQFEKLFTLRASLIPPVIPDEPEKPWYKREVFEALAPAVSNLLGIAMILQHERVHVVTSKALGFVTKAKL